MKKLITTTILLCGIGAASLQADWTVISTFDDASALDIVTDVTNIEGSMAGSEIVDGKLAAKHGDLFESTSNLYALIDMGMDLKAASQASGGPVTVYFEVSQPTVPDGVGGTRKAIVDTVWGLSNVGAESVLETRYNSYNVMQRINSGTDVFEGRNGGGYWATLGGQQFTADETYKIWVVVDYNLNYYQSYIQGGQWAEQTQLDTEDLSNVWLFRVNPAPEETVSNFLIALSRGNSVDGEKGIDETHFDNLVVDTTGENLTTPAVGGWTVVSTFDDASALDIVTDVTNIEGSMAGSEIVDGKLAAKHGDLFESTSNLYALIDMGVDLKAASQTSGGPVSVYFEVTQPTVPDGVGGTRKAIVDTVWGLSNVGAESVLETRYNSYNVMQRINSGTDVFEGRNGGGYWATLGGQQFTADETYKIWVVVDYNLNYYQSYIQGGQWAEQTQLDTEDLSNVWLFRVNPAPEETVSNFLIALSRGNSVDGEKGIDETHFDNLAYDLSGENLGTPNISGGGDPVETWAGYPIVNDAGDVNTNTFLGWINVSAAPFILSYNVGWIYLEESTVTNAGAWAYFYK